MIPIYLIAVGLRAPGLLGWSASLPILRGQQPYQPTALPAFSPRHLLSANECRRTTASVKLALQVAQEATANTRLPVSQISSVFVSSDADLEIIDKICRGLMLPDHPLSPTDFHNSVHNAAAGYWAIGTGSNNLSTSLSAREMTLAAGILEAATLVTVEKLSVLLVASDYPAPSPLNEVCGIEGPFATALLLTTELTADSLASLTLRLTTQSEETRLLSQPDLEKLRLSSPAARSLPLLQALANDVENSIALAYLSGQQLVIEVKPEKRL
ncbi:MAG: hypothetical protein BWK79_03220 [Beggiatoa sp. IS2]|nr:MAG: hypothetical protein BWK79_03220 [Beggiatoa sp. IS2]